MTEQPVSSPGDTEGERLRGELAATREALAHERLRTHLIAQATKDAVWDFDLVRDEVSWDDGISALFGYPAFEVRSPSTWWSGCIHPEDAERVLEGMERAIAEGASHWTAEYRFRRRDGHYADVLDRGFIVRETGGRAIRMLGSMRDVTERKRWEETLSAQGEELKALSSQLIARNLEVETQVAERTAELRERKLQMALAQEIAHLGSWVYDYAREHLSWSDELYRLLEVEPGGAPPTVRFALSHLHPDDRATFEAIFRQALVTGDFPPVTFRIVRRDGAVRHMQAQGRLLRHPDGTPDRTIGTMLDITERMERQAALEAQHRHLLELDHLKTSFMNMVSHELRTPLTAIKGYGEFLEDEIAGPLNASQREFVQRIQEGVLRLQRLVDDLLDFARIEAGTFKLLLQPTDACTLVHDEVRRLRPLAVQAGLKLDVHLPAEPLRAVIDAARIGQVLTNLLGNAIKFTPRGGRVLVELEADEAGLVVSVRDDGPGIAEADLPRLFEKFFQVDPSTTRAHGGAGLGLTICKGLVDAHGGTIGVESALGAGSRFWFRLPRASQPPSLAR